MISQLRQRGEGTLGCVFWIAVLLIFGFVCFKAVPVKIKSSQLYDYMVEQAKFAGRTSADAMEKRILRKARELELPLSKKDVKVSKGRGKIKMTVKYTVPVDFLVYQYDWDFEYEVDRQVFII